MLTITTITVIIIVFMAVRGGGRCSGLVGIHTWAHGFPTLFATCAAEIATDLLQTACRTSDGAVLSRAVVGVVPARHCEQLGRLLALPFQCGIRPAAYVEDRQDISARRSQGKDTQHGRLKSAPPPSGVAAFKSAHSKTPYITPSMEFSSGKGYEGAGGSSWNFPCPASKEQVSIHHPNQPAKSRSPSTTQIRPQAAAVFYKYYLFLCICFAYILGVTRTFFGKRIKVIHVCAPTEVGAAQSRVDPESIAAGKSSTCR